MSAKIMNKPENVIPELMEGFVGAYSRYFVKHPEVNGIISRQRRRDKVALVIGGGSGHEPMYSGFVGPGLGDAAACGNIFASPDPNTIYKTAKAVDNGKGVLFVYGCYAGDNLNFDMGEEFLNDDGIKTAHVRIRDDVASAPKDRIDDRRGIAGNLYVVKMAGAACDACDTLEEATRIAAKAEENTHSIGIATAPAQLPGLDKPIFELPEGEIEYGMGIHGERGVLRTKMEPADVLTEKMYDQLMADAQIPKGTEVCVLINGLGSTTLLELSIVFRKVKQLLLRDGYSIYDSDLGSFCTTQEMGGFSISLLALDDELKTYYDMPCYCPFYAKGSVSGTAAADAGDIEEEIPTEPEFDESDTEAAEIRRSHPGVLEELNAEDTRNMLIYVADRIIANKNYLTEVDSAIGDGDHGMGMAGGMQKAKKKLLRMADTENVYDIFDAAGKAMLLSMGGASGVIFGSLYLAGAKDMPETAVLKSADLAAMERKSLTAIQEKGHAQVGDKTMVDALAPAVEALEANSDKPLLEMLKCAEEAAKQGVENSKNCVAKFGRAKSLMERAIGFQDAGATSVYLIFKSMREYVEDACV